MLYTPDYRRHLPHFTPKDAPFFITTRLTDSLPVSVLRQFQRDHLDLIKRREQEPNIDPEVLRRLQKRYIVEADKHLDDCRHGPTWLMRPSIAGLVKANVMRLERDLVITNWCFTIMPNHVHLLFSLRSGSLAQAMQLLKGRTAMAANRLLGRSGPFWQHESYDHVVRENEFGRIIRYILPNPVKAQLCPGWKNWPWTFLYPEAKVPGDI